MQPTHENLARITFDDLQALEASRAPESEVIDFKQSIPKDKTTEFCKDIAAMANTKGGCIVIGMSDLDGHARELLGVDEKIDPLIRRLQQSAESNILPRVRIHFRSIAITETRSVLLATVARSGSGPHQLKEDWRFYKRLDRNNQPMNDDEVRAAVLQSRSQEQIAREEHTKYRKTRPFMAGGSSISFLSVIPAPFGEEIFDFTSPQTRSLATALDVMTGGYLRDRLIFDGLRFENPQRPEHELIVSRAGVIHVRWPNDSRGERMIFPDHMKDQFGLFVPRVRSLFADNAIETPMHLLWTIEGAAGCQHPTTFTADYKPIVEAVLEFPAVFVPDSQTDVMPMLNDWRARLYNAFGVYVTR